MEWTGANKLKFNLEDNTLRGQEVLLENAECDPGFKVPVLDGTVLPLKEQVCALGVVLRSRSTAGCAGGRCGQKCLLSASAS